MTLVMVQALFALTARRVPRRMRARLLAWAGVLCLARGIAHMPSAGRASAFVGRPSAAPLAAARRPHGLGPVGAKKKRKFR
jgi:hypothetical protein